MKSTSLPILIAIFAFFACGNPSNTGFPPTIIKGKIAHTVHKNRISINGVDFDEIEKRRKEISLVTNAVRNGLDAPNHNGQLDEDGNYHFIIKMEQPTELRIQYRHSSVPFYAKPGDEIKVDFDLNNDIPYTVSGDNMAINQKISEYDQLFRDSFHVELNATLPYVIPREFKEQRAKITERIRRVTEDFIEKNAVDNPILANWATHHSEYRIAMDYMKYGFKTTGFNRFSPDLKEGFPTGYFDFWEEFPVNNSKAIINLNYQNYLQLYRKYLMANLAQTAPYQDCKNLPGCNIFEMELATLTSNLEGKTKDLMLSQQVDYHLVRNNDFFIEKGFDQYLGAISDSLLVKELQARKDYLYTERSFEFPSDVTLYQSNGTGPQILKEIAKKHQNRPTILYFWNTQTQIVWSYNAINHKQAPWKILDSLNFDLVLLAHHSTPNSWKDQILDLKLIQDQWLLSDAQYAYFEDYFFDVRKKHHFYDRIRHYENFILALDDTGALTIPKEMPFYYLYSMARNLKWQITRGEKINLISNN